MWFQITVLKCMRSVIITANVLDFHILELYGLFACAVQFILKMLNLKYSTQ